MVAIFGGLWLFFGHGPLFFGPLFFILVFAGFLPLVRGIVRLLGRELPTHEIDEEEPGYVLQKTPQKGLLEKEALKVAKQEGGRVTPAMASLEMSCTLEETEKILEDMASRGYARMEVTEDGRVEYVFPEFLPRSGDGSNS